MVLGCWTAPDEVELRAAEQELERHGYQAAKRKEEYFLSQTCARGQRKPTAERTLKDPPEWC
jgi:hypothetical protein